jgi:hypothetical protein
MTMTVVAPLVKQYFEEAYARDPLEDIYPRDVADWVDEERRRRGTLTDGSTQSGGAVRSCINRAEEAGWAVIVPGGGPVRYHYDPNGRPRSTLAPPSGARRQRKQSEWPRPNGDIYRARMIGDFSDVEMLRDARRIHKFAMLAGPPGGGKTALIEAAFPDCITMNGDADTGVSDFVGDYARMPREVNDPNRTDAENRELADEDAADAWMDGPLVQAMLKDVPLFIDDATLVAPGVMSVLYPLMDGRNQIYVKSRPRKLGRQVVAGPNFYIVAAHNPGVPGAFLSEALSSRFRLQIQVGTDYDLARSLGVHGELIKVAKHMETNRRNGECDWAPQMRDLLSFKENMTEWDIPTACGALLAQAPEGEDREKLRQALAIHFSREGITSDSGVLALGGQV